MLKETMSNWQCVADQIKHQQAIACGPLVTHLFYQAPQSLMETLTYYKFAAKIIGKNKRILDVGCQEGFGSYLLAKECGFVYGRDLNHISIENAQKNFQNSQLEFLVGDCSNLSLPLLDAVVNFCHADSLILQKPDVYLQQISLRLLPTGMAILGFPHQSEFMAVLEREMRNQFSFVFLFTACGEVIQPKEEEKFNAPYYIAVCCKKR